MRYKIVATSQEVSQIVEADNIATALDIALNTPNGWRIEQITMSFRFDQVIE